MRRYTAASSLGAAPPVTLPIDQERRGNPLTPLFARRATAVRVLHIGTFLRLRFRCPTTYNDGAYTFLITATPICSSNPRSN